MTKIIYNKLVRDLIPNIIEKSGKNLLTETLSDENFLIKLNEKLNEEIQEYNESNEVEELADIIEVIYAILNVRKISKKHLDKIRVDKAHKNGKFLKKVLLVEVSE